MAVNVKQVVPFLRVSSMERSTRYYLDGLGFSIRHKWVADGKLRWRWLERGRATLMLEETRHPPAGGESRPGCVAGLYLRGRRGF
jgi:hypothetical protein